METYTVTEADIKNFHNARCDFFFALEGLKDILKEDNHSLSRLKTGLTLFDKSFAKLRKESEERMEKKDVMFDKFRKEHNLSSIFSIYSIDSLTEIAKCGGVDKKLPLAFTLVSYYTKKTVEFKSEVAATYAELWKLADVLIKDADDSHIFIEGFRKKDENTVEVVLGS